MIFLRNLILAVGLMFVLLVAGCTGQSTPAPSEGASTGTPPATYTATIGQKFSQCSVDVLVDSATISQTITYIDSGGNSQQMSAQEGKKLVLVNVEIKNNYNDAVVTGSYYFSVMDQDGINYKPQCPINLYGNCKTSDSWYLSDSTDVIPGQLLKGYLIYSIPSNSTVKLVYKIQYVHDCEGVKYLYWDVTG